MIDPASLRRHRRFRFPVLSDRRGAAIVEFALVAAPFLALLLAILLTSLAYLAQEALETTVEAAARNIVTGRTQSGDVQGSNAGMTKAELAERFRKTGCAALPPFMSCDRLYVDVQSAATGNALAHNIPHLTCDTAGRLINSFSYDVGTQGSLVMVRFFYVWPMPVAPNIDLSLPGNGQTILVATSVSKSEAYL
ncbi:TadE/TadG family type IV pilus assembly protein [Sphingomonas fuzhouensis]|uniref:TadE/TadG family type IV pilus assembly protein n=1 Tax=Sphingomonas fuzhouensis TaxID=3106033 RepID=UPI002AFF0AB7|nr:TadE/TadG family type IV pilus assembly protein [Sphingomonas sp. SGZ-02]